MNYFEHKRRGDYNPGRFPRNADLNATETIWAIKLYGEAMFSALEREAEHNVMCFCINNWPLVPLLFGGN